MAGRTSEKFPWLPLVILVVSLIIFWIVPATNPNPKVTATAAQTK